MWWMLLPFLGLLVLLFVLSPLATYVAIIAFLAALFVRHFAPALGAKEHLED